MRRIVVCIVLLNIFRFFGVLDIVLSIERAFFRNLYLLFSFMSLLNKIVQNRIVVYTLGLNKWLLLYANNAHIPKQHTNTN